MKILFLGPQRPHLIDFIKVIHIESSLSERPEILNYTDFILSYGYRHIIKKEIVARFPKKIINLHLSYLPWNRGTDPNLWSFLENTPKGVTIHFIDEGLDTGEILAQERVTFDTKETLLTSYEYLTKRIEKLFCRIWPDVRNGTIKSYPQPPGGSFHRSKDRAKYEYLLIKGWDTSVSELSGKAHKY